MQYSWLKKTKSDSLIVFYSGWGMTESSVALNPRVYDLLIFYDYRDIHLSAQLLEEINAYKVIYIVAWSLGIVPAVLNKELIEATKLIAINGSLFPSDDKYGIPEAIYQGTYENLDKKNLDRFYKRMFEDNKQYEEFKQIHNPVEISQLKEELTAIRGLSTTLTINDKNIFDRVIVSTKDKIFPLNNLNALWDNAILLDKAHYPFFDFKDWLEILNV